MESEDAKHSVQQAMQTAGLKGDKEGPRVLTDNGSCYIREIFQQLIREEGLGHVGGAPYHPQIQGKIERYHLNMKNVVKHENYFFPDVLRSSICAFVNFYNHERYYEFLDNLIPRIFHLGKDWEVKTKRHLTKIKTLNERRKVNQKRSA